MMKRTISRALPMVISAALPFVAGCTNKQGETESPVYMTTNLVTGAAQPLVFNITPGAPLQLTAMTVTSHAKSTSVTDPNGFQTIELKTYTVHYSRFDGGTKVPPDEIFAAGGGLIPLNGSLTLNNFPVITGAASQQSPFDQLLPFNGGIDQQTGLTTIHLGITVTFFGDTVAGTRVSSDPATMGIFVVAQ
jgi:hypothetical protein